MTNFDRSPPETATSAIQNAQQYIFCYDGVSLSESTSQSSMNQPTTHWDVIWESEEDEPPLTGLPSYLQDLAQALELGDAECSVLLAHDTRIRELNRTFRHIDQTTDVLSFPMTENPNNHLGDIAISIDRTRQQAVELEQTFATELRFLIMHGLLHLLGYDHETDDGEMLAKQRELRVKLAQHFAED